MSWSQSIDIYCERLGPEFWAEPVNAISNAGFVLVGLAMLWRSFGARRPDLLAAFLSADVVAVGIGSFLFHSFATRWAGLADVLPIMAFIMVYFGAALHRFAGLHWGVSGLAALAFMGVSGAGAAQLTRLTGGALNGSESYLPAFFALVGIGAWLSLARGHRAGRWLLAASGVFALSILFRSMDAEICPAFPTGTHFLWHLLNAAVFLLLLDALLRHGAGENRGRAQ